MRKIKCMVCYHKKTCLHRKEKFIFGFVKTDQRDAYVATGSIICSVAIFALVKGKFPKGTRH